MKYEQLDTNITLLVKDFDIPLILAIGFLALIIYWFGSKALDHYSQKDKDYVDEMELATKETLDSLYQGRKEKRTKK